MGRSGRVGLGKSSTHELTVPAGMDGRSIEKVGTTCPRVTCMDAPQERSALPPHSVPDHSPDMGENRLLAGPENAPDRLVMGDLSQAQGLTHPLNDLLVVLDSALWKYKCDPHRLTNLWVGARSITHIKLNGFTCTCKWHDWRLPSRPHCPKTRCYARGIHRNVWNFINTTPWSSLR